MGIFNIIAGLAGASTGTTSGADQQTLTCDCCGGPVRVEDMEEGQCEECRYSDSGSSYCCGMIYEEGEFVCASCGDPL